MLEKTAFTAADNAYHSEISRFAVIDIPDYTDREKIRKIFAGCTPTALLGSWKDYSDYDMDYLANASVRDAASPFTLYFEKNSVPDFVQKDLQGD